MPGNPSGMHANVSRPSHWPWLIAPATIAVFVVIGLVDPVRGFYPLVMITLSAIVLLEVVGALLWSRVPGNVIGPLLVATGATLAATIAVGTVTTIAAVHADARVPQDVLAVGGFINDVGVIVPMVIVLIGVPLVFPDGNLPSPRWRWVVALCAAALLADAVAKLVGPDPLGQAGIPNPFAVPAMAGIAAALEAFANWASIVVFGAAALAIVVRYRRGDDVERHQLKWLIATAGVAAVAFPTAFIAPWQVVSDAAFLVGLLALVALPIAIGVAILRYRLYDIDRIISRTIAWALISGLLVGGFAVLVVGLQTVLVGVTQADAVAVAASTLVAFVLFQPVRRTVQAVVDRRFDRARYDAQRTAEAFGDRLRNEVDLDTLATELEGTVSAAIRPTRASLWLPRRETP
jgi:hypothetical protein